MSIGKALLRAVVGVGAVFGAIIGMLFWSDFAFDVAGYGIAGIALLVSPIALIFIVLLTWIFVKTD